MPEHGKKVVSQFNKARGQRGNWETLWQEIADVVEPSRTFLGDVTEGRKRNLDIFDNTAPMSSRMLADALHGQLTNPAIKWFLLRAASDSISEIDRVKGWLDVAANAMLGVFSNPRMGFNTNIHEVYIDLAAFGTSAISVIEALDPNVVILFRARPLSQIYVENDSEGMVSVAYNLFQLTGQQAIDEFGLKNLSSEIQREASAGQGLDRKSEYIQAVFPRTDRVLGRPRVLGRLDVRNKRFESTTVEKKTGHVVRESGFDEFPFIISRWTKLADEVYGRSPAMSVLDDIGVANAMARTMLIAGEMAIHPPLQVPANSIEGPVRQVPGGITAVRSDGEKITPLFTNISIPTGQSMLEHVQESIKRGFFGDIIGPLPESDRMTATEIAARVQQRMQMLSPALARLQQELLSPLIARVFRIMLRRGLFPPMPPELSGARMEIDYVSPMALAQKASELRNLQQLLGVVQPLVQITPNILDNLDTDEIIRHGARLVNVPQRLIRPVEDVNALRQQRAEAENAQQAVDIAKTAAEAGESAAKASEALAGAL